jgi:hypothetical protein
LDNPNEYKLREIKNNNMNTAITNKEKFISQNFLAIFEKAKENDQKRTNDSNLKQNYLNYKKNSTKFEDLEYLEIPEFKYSSTQCERNIICKLVKQEE